MKKIILLTFILTILISCTGKQENITIDKKIVPPIIVENIITEKIITEEVDISNLITEALLIEEPVVKKIIPEFEKLLNTNKEAPALIGLTNWINGAEIKSLEELEGKVVFIDFWTYSCINCIRTLGHMQELHENYKDQGLVILGLHAPEFSYERKLENLQKEVKKYGLTYRIAQDNDFATWKNYKNRYWPAQYIIDKKGQLRYIHYGEGKYQEMNEVVEGLLSQK